jgi:hypothetical protein
MYQRSHCRVSKTFRLSETFTMMGALGHAYALSGNARRRATPWPTCETVEATLCSSVDLAVIYAGLADKTPSVT